jgi:MFS family permease
MMRAVEDEASVGATTPLRRNWNYLALTSGETVSTLGGAVASFAMPLVVLTATGSPFQAGLVAMAGMIGNLGATAFVGGWVDGHSRRAAMVWSLAVRCGTWLALALLVATSNVSATAFVVIAFVGGVASALYRAAEAGALKVIITQEQFPAAMSVIEARGAVADLAGGPLGAILLSIALAVPFWFNMATYVASLIGVISVRAEMGRPEHATSGPFGTALKQGLKYISERPAFRVILVSQAISNFGMNAFNFALILILRQAGHPLWAIGLFQAAIGLSLLLGSLMAPRIIRAMDVGQIVVGSAGIRTLIIVVIALLHSSIPLVLALTVLCYLLVPASNGAAMSYLFVVTPNHFQGRIASAEQFASTALMPLTTVAAGAFVSIFAPTAALLILVASVALSTVIMAMASEVRRLPRLANARDALEISE